MQKGSQNGLNGRGSQRPSIAALHRYLNQPTRERPVLARHSAIYFVGRIVPGVVSLLSIVLYTRLLSAEDFGRYSLIIAAVGILNAVFFQWLSLSLGRLMPGHPRQQALLSAAMVGYLGLVALTVVVGAALAWYTTRRQAQLAIVLVLATTWAQAWFDLNLRLLNARLDPVKYGLYSSARALVALGIGAGLALAGYGTTGVVLGTTCSLVLTALPLSTEWTTATIRSVRARHIRPFVDYGGPFALTFAMTMVLQSADRFLLGWIASTSEVAVYAASYDLAMQSLGGFLAVVHLAAYPLAVRALERSGWHAAADQVQQNLLALSTVAVPATLGLIVLSGNIAHTLIGAAARDGAQSLIPIVAAAVLVWGFKSYYLDFAFQLTQRTRMQLWPVAGAALLNVILNLLWIPRFRLEGAAWATLVAYVFGTLLAWTLGKRVFHYPRGHRDLRKVLAAGLGMGAVIWSTAHWRGAFALMMQVAIGAGAYALLLALMNACGVRAKLKTWMRAGQQET